MLLLLLVVFFQKVFVELRVSIITVKCDTLIIAYLSIIMHHKNIIIKSRVMIKVSGRITDWFNIVSLLHCIVLLSDFIVCVFKITLL